MKTHSPWWLVSSLTLASWVAGYAAATPASDFARSERQQALRGTRATYCRAPRTPDQRVDVEKLIAELVEVGANTYSFCIHNWATDWDDLHRILPAARAKGIRVWASIVPPTESPPRLKMYAEPFRLDYHRWAEEFAKLSLRETNLIAWSIDDFVHNLKLYTPEYVREMQAKAHAINPRLAFAPCCYFRQTTPEFAKRYGHLLDGILFPYRHESGGPNLTNTTLIEPEIQMLRERFAPGFPIILDIYATAHSKLGATTPEYVEEAMLAGRRAADGVMIYCHQNPKTNAAKFEIVKRQFSAWSAQEDAAFRRAALKGTFGTYNAAPRTADGRVGLDRLLAELATLRAHTYNWLVWHAASDWEDLQLFLPRAAEKGIKVWVSLVPPSESPPRTKSFSEPFRLDYDRWAMEIAKLSLAHPNLVAWSIDDFAHNLKVYPPEQVKRMLDAARTLNPRLAFVPCLYYRQCKAEFARDYGPLLDGILFPYRNESGTQNLTDTAAVESEVAKLKELFGPGLPVFVDVYATKHSRLNDSSPEYVEQVMQLGWRSADGVLIYCHQNPATQAAKFAVIKNLFQDWSAEAGKR